MGEEVKMTDYDTNGEEEEEEEEEEEDNYNGIADNNGVDDDDERVLEWEAGLPEAGDLTPLSQALIPPELASAFSISPEPRRTLIDVNRASQTTLSNLRGGCSQLNALSSNNFKSFAETRTRDPMASDGEEMANGNHNKESNNNENFVGPGRVEGSGSESRNNKMRKIESEEADSVAMRTAEEDPSSAAMRATAKRPRLVWTPQLHKRFVDVVAHMGIKNAVPKTIMQLMNVEGLTRENVASHLQKYRLYLKRMQGLSTEGPSSSDHLFASTPVPQSLRESGGGSGSGGGGCGGGGGGGGGAGGPNGHMGMPIPMPYHQGPMMPIPIYGLPHMQMGNNGSNHQYRHHLQQFDGNYGYNGMLQQRDWSGNNHGSVISYPRHPHPHHVAPQDNM